MSEEAAPPTVLIAWRHPRPRGAEGRCIGARTDLPVDPRKAKRLAHRIRRTARREGLPREVAVSPLRRCRDVGRWLRRWGFKCVVDARLIECDFGRWDGRRWDDIAREEIDAWAADLHDYRPGGGESVAMLLERVRAVLRDAPAGLLVTHGGWVSGWIWLRDAGAVRATASDWPAAPRWGVAVRLK
ncbi:histidine phosphatase family protein [uncultured Methylibium sp.]|uniref:histidine phosphatase family protein n=1 Tax=uncultured Methylibium sp. TaxID=381093 RepID=UPI0025CC45A0|nr:histidine phosphatase family protein [uncultured Methylibium sp.]